MWRGSFYKRRQYDAQPTGKKMPAAVKYSRGGRPTDPESIVEKGDGDIGYVTLITFKGGKRQEQWAAKGQQKAAPKQAPVSESEKPAPLTDVEPDFDALSEEAVGKLQDHLRGRLAGTKYAGFSFVAFANSVLTDTTVTKLGELTINQGRDVMRAAVQANKDAKDAAA